MSESIARMIDHSLLQPTLTEDQVRQGCELARRLEVASVCVQPWAIPLAAEVLSGSPVRVGTVVGFPQGANATATKVHEAELACQQGAVELDMVVNISKVLSEDWDYVARDIAAVVQTAHRFGAITKVIFENDFLPSDDFKIKLCHICEEIGAEYVKTSTGFGFVKQPDGSYRYRGATEHDVILMRKTCSPRVKIKAAGGIRTYEQAVRFRDLGVDRIGASATQQILEQEAQALRSGQS